jgi:hypothetical protein
MSRGFLYLVAIIDWASRAVLAWRLSNSMDVSFCLEALDEALARFGKPEIFNTDQGSQFTSAAFTGRLEAAGIGVSMDGRGPSPVRRPASLRARIDRAAIDGSIMSSSSGCGARSSMRRSISKRTPTAARPGPVSPLG